MELLKSERLQSSLKFLTNIGAVIITLVLPYFYVIGLAYYDGQMNASGLSADLYPISTADIYVKAFFAILTCIAEFMREMVGFFGLDQAHWKQTLGLSLLLLGVLNGLDRFEKSEFSSILMQKKTSKGDDGTASTLFLLMSQSYFILVMLIFILSWGIVLAVQAGKSASAREIDKYAKFGCIFDQKTHWNNCVRLKDKGGTVLHEGLLIIKTESEVAIFEKSQALILKLNQDDVIVRLKK